MRYFILLMTLVLSSCSNDDQVNEGWVIYDLLPLDGGRVIYYGEDERVSIFKNNRIIFSICIYQFSIIRGQSP